MAGGLIISNTTPVINFAQIGRIDLLQQLFGAVAIPPAVAREAAERAALFPLAAEAVSCGAFPLAAPLDVRLVRALSSRVHLGESECIVLAIESPGSLLLLDDLAARELAEANGCKFIGTLGCLIEAKRRGLVPALAPLLADLRLKARFWITDRLISEVLRRVGEA